jgi:cysteinyl-tRNA synthetase
MNESESESLRILSEELEPAFIKAMDDDFNTAAALGHLFSALGTLNGVLDGVEAVTGKISVHWKAGVDGFFKNIGSVLGFFENSLQEGPTYFAVSTTGDDEGEKKAQALAEERDEARKRKDWARADELRDQIAGMGYTVQDTVQGPVLIPLKVES